MKSMKNKRNIVSLMALAVGLSMLLASCTTTPKVPSDGRSLEEKRAELEKQVMALRSAERRLQYLKDMYEIEQKKNSYYENRSMEKNRQMRSLASSMHELLDTKQNLFYDVFLRGTVDENSSAAVSMPGTQYGRTLIVDMSQPVRKNCLIYGGDLMFDRPTGTEGVFFVVLTPATTFANNTKGIQGGDALGSIKLNGAEVSNAIKMTEQNTNQRSYEQPRSGLFRQTIADEWTIPDYFVIRDTLKVKTSEKDIDARFVSEPCFCSEGTPCKKSFVFARPLTAFAGDYIGIFVPGEGIIRFTEGSGNRDTYFTGFDELNGRLQGSNEKGSGLTFDKIESKRCNFEKGKNRRAAFSVYGVTVEP